MSSASHSRHVPSAFTRLAQRNAAIANQQQRFTTQVPNYALQGLSAGSLQAMASGLAQQHMAQHTQQQQMVLSQQMAQQLAQAQQNAAYGNPYTNAGWNISNSGTTAITTSSAVPAGAVWVTTSNTPMYMTGATTSSSTYATGVVMNDLDYGRGICRDINIDDGEEKDINLPDGTRIRVAKDGSYKIEDKDAKVVYRANKMRDFNRFINVSDRLEEFIAFCGDQAVKQGEMLELPLKLFVAWLAIEAAKADSEPPPETNLLPALAQRKNPCCRVCGHRIKPALAQAKIFFCSEFCFRAAYLTYTEPPPVLLLPPPEKMRPLQ